MLCSKTVRLALSLLLLGFLAACGQQPTPSAETEKSAPVATAESTASETAPAEQAPAEAAHAEAEDPTHIFEGGAHQDHDSKHGGTFFMALDNRHHLEGALEQPGIFRVYIYDAYTQPVSREELGQTQAKVIWGENDGAPEVELKPAADGTCMEAQAPAPVRFPVTLTLLTRLPGSAPNSRPELFTFPFSHYSHIDVTPHQH